MDKQIHSDSVTQLINMLCSAMIENFQHPGNKQLRLHLNQEKIFLQFLHAEVCDCCPAALNYKHFEQDSK